MTFPCLEIKQKTLKDVFFFFFLVSFQFLATRGYNKTFLMEEVLQRYLSEELGERRKIHEEEMNELAKSVDCLLFIF